VRRTRLARRLHRGLIYPGLDFLLPSACFGCGEPLGAVQRLGACARCWTGLTLVSERHCPACGLPRPPGTDLTGPSAGRCASCILAPPAADRVRAAVVYDATARSFLLRAKIGRVRELFGPLSDQLARAIEIGDIAAASTAVVAVPSDPVAWLTRGFSPATELARPVAQRLGLPLLRRVLGRRLRLREATKRLGARRRREIVREHYRIRRRMDGARVLLIDDVMTTGSTVDACARLLKGAGAAEVRAAVWARTLPHEPGFDRDFPGRS
jgi:predicted amidophosphoribosyltransferase